MFHGIGPEARDTSSKNRKFGPPWLGGRLLRCRRLRRFRNCVGLSLDWQLVTLTRFSLSSKKQKKETLMNPCLELTLQYVVKGYLFSLQK